MNDKLKISGRMVHIIARDSFELKGVIEHIEDDFIVVRKNDKMIIVYKANLIAAELIEDVEDESLIDSIINKHYQDYEDEDDSDSSSLPTPMFVRQRPYAESGDEESNSAYGSIIPSDMLIGDDDGIQTTFSMSMSSLVNPNPNRGSYGSREEDESDREEDSE